MTSVNVTTTKNTVTVNGETRVVTIKTEGPQGPAFADGDIGDIVISGGGTVATIDNGAVNNAKIASNAAIDLTKLATGALPTAITVTSANISDLSIVNADINASAAIAGTKISPDFGSQNIVTTGTGATGALGVTGNITVSGTVDGRDVAADGTKLDGIESGATADQTASEILTLIKTVDGAGSGLDADTLDGISSASFVRSDADDTMTGNLTLSNTGPKLIFNDTDNNSDFRIKVQGGSFLIEDTTNSNADRFEIASDGTVDVYGNLDVGAGLDVTGNITATGTVDGRDIATDGTKLDGIETGATADQTAAEIKTLLDSNGIVNSNVDASAAIAGTKISPDFGSQNIVTTGTIASDNITITGATPTLTFTDNDANPDYEIRNHSGYFAIRDATNNANKIRVNPDGHIDIHAFLECLNSLSVTGNITVSGTVDGVDIATRDTLFGGLTSSSGVLTNGVTATTQSASDNSTKVATTAYTDTAIANLVDSAPGTLNTLNELAAALGDDANFSTTVTNSIATKLPLAGGTLTGNVIHNDNVKAIFGTGSDFEIFHNGSNSIINDSGQGNIQIQNAGNTILGVTSAGINLTGNIIVSGTVDGRDVATDGTKLDGIESNATADQTASEIVALVADQTIAPSTIDMEDNERIKLGASDDLEIYHTGNNGIIDNKTNDLFLRTTGSGDDIFIQSADNATIQVAGSQTGIKAFGGGAVELYHDNSKKLETTSNGSQITGNLGINTPPATPNGNSITLYASDFPQYRLVNSTTGTATTDGSKIFLNSDDLLISNEENGGEIKFKTNSSGSAERFKITAAGNVQIPADSAQLQIGAGQDLELYHDSINSYIENNTNFLQINSTSAVFIKAGNEHCIDAIHNGAVKLFYDNSKKFETTANAAKITGSTGNVTFNEFGHINLQNTNNGTTNFWALAPRGAGNFTIGYGPYESGTEKVGQTYNLLNFTTGGDVQIPNDNKKLEIGAGQDLQLYHNGSASVIRDNGTGNLQIAASAIQLTNNAITENMLIALPDGAVELYYDNDLHFATTSQGCKTNGDLSIQGDGGSEQALFDVSDGSLKFVDNIKAKFGSGDDLQIYHNGTDSVIRDDGTGNLNLQTLNSNINAYVNTNELSASFITNGAVELYYDNVKKAQTLPQGFEVIGVTHSDGLDMDDNHKILLGTGDDFELYFNGTNSHITSFSNNLFIQTSSNEIIFHCGDFKVLTNGNAHNGLIVNSQGSVDLYHNNSKKFETTANGATVTGRLEVGTTIKLHSSAAASTPGSNGNATRFLEIIGSNTAGSTEIGAIKFTNVDSTTYQAASIACFNEGGSDDGNLIFNIANGGTAATAMKITSVGHVDIPVDSKKLRIGAAGDLQIYHDGSHSFVQDVGTGSLKLAGADVHIVNADNTAVLAQFISGGKNELRFDNSTKLETKSDGVDITGELQCDSLDVDGTASFTPGSGNFVNFFGASNHAKWDVSNSRFLWDDNAKAVFGDSADLQIYHSSDISRIRNTNDSGTLKIQATSNGENAINIVPNGTTELYFDGTKKFETTSSGITVSGSNTTGSRINGSLVLATEDGTTNLELFGSSGVLRFYDNKKATFGTGDDLQIYHDGSDSYIDDVGTGILNIRSSEIRLGKAGTTEVMIRAIPDAQVDLYYDGVNRLKTSSTGVTVTGNIAVSGTVDGVDVAALSASVSGFLSNVVEDTSPQLGGNLSTNGNNINFGDSSGTSDDRATFGAAGDLQIYHDGTNSYILENGTGGLNIKTNGTAIDLTKTPHENLARFIVDGAVELYYDNTLRLETRANDVKFHGGLIGVDDVKLQLGNSGDLQLYHDGSASYIKNFDGRLRIVGAGGTDQDIQLQAKNGEFSVRAVPHAQVELYYDHSKKLETTSTGATLTGTLIADGLTLYDNEKLLIGTNTDIEIFHNGTNSIFQSDTGDLQINSGNSAGNVEINLNNNVAGDTRETSAKFIKNGAVELYYDNVKKFETTSYGAFVNGRLSLDDSNKITLGDSMDLQLYHDGSHSYIQDTGAGELRFTSNTYKFYNAAFSETLIEAFEDGAVNLYYDGTKKFETISSGVQVSGTLFIPDGGQASNRISVGNSGDLQIFHDSNNSKITHGGAGGLYIGADTFALQKGDHSENYISMTANGAVELYHDNVKMLETTAIGLTISGDVKIIDNENLRLGDGNDLLIYHTGSHSLIENSTGELRINNSSGSDMILNSTGRVQLQVANGEKAVYCDNNGSVELYFNNSKKFETTSYGALVTGTLSAGSGNFDVTDNGKFKAGNSSDLQIFHDGSSSRIYNSTGDLVFRSASYNLNSADGSEPIIVGAQNGSVELYYDNSKKFETTSTGINIPASVPTITLSDTDGNTPYSRITAGGGDLVFEADQGDEEGNTLMLFRVDDSEAMRIDSDQRVSIGGSSSVSTKLHIENSSGDAHIRLRGSANCGVLYTRHSDAALIGYTGSGNAVNLGSSNIAISASLSGGRIVFQTGGTAAGNERVSINSTGMMLFDGDQTADNPWGATFREDSSGSPNSVRLFFEGDNGVSNRTFSLMSENGKFRISGGGTAGGSTGSQLIYLASTTATSWTGGSDIRLKENITEIPNVLDKIKNYRCARFNFIGDDASDIQNIKFGFIAQDWLTDFPEVISKSTQDADDPTDTTEYYGMQYTETIPVLLKAIQELTARLEKLEGA